MKEEREGLLQDLAKLKTALHHLAARNQGTLPSSLCLPAPPASAVMFGYSTREALCLRWQCVQSFWILLLALHKVEVW